MPPDPIRSTIIALPLGLVCAVPLCAAQDSGGGAEQDDTSPPMTTGRPGPGASAREAPPADPPPIEDPAVPPGMTLDEVLERAGREPPQDWPHVVADDRLLTYVLVDQLEYRARKGRDALGWEAEAWLGYDYDKLWFESAGEAMLEGEDEIAVTHEMKYSRLITPFWNFQVGVANELTWTEAETESTWAAVVALDGMAPYMFECTPSLELTEDGDLFGSFEAEYNLRITQRLVLQPRTEMEFAAQDMPEAHTGAGLTHVALDLRLRYAIRREFAPYLGVRYKFLVGETHSLASDRGEDPDNVALLAGMRLAF